MTTTADTATQHTDWCDDHLYDPVDLSDLGCCRRTHRFRDVVLTLTVERGKLEILIDGDGHHYWTPKQVRDVVWGLTEMTDIIETGSLAGREARGEELSREIDGMIRATEQRGYRQCEEEFLWRELHAR